MDDFDKRKAEDRDKKVDICNRNLTSLTLSHINHTINKILTSFLNLDC